MPSRGAAGEIFPPITVGWSLNFEMYFYIVCGIVIAAWGGRRLLEGVTAIILTVVGAGLLFANDSIRQNYPIVVLSLPITLEFLAGMWLAHLSQTKSFSTPTKFALGLCLVGALGAAIVPASQPYSELRAVYWGVPAVAIIWAVLSTEGKFAYHKWKPALLLGEASYALYLVHPIVLAVVWTVVQKLNLSISIYLLFIVMVAFSIFAGVLTHIILEKPILKVIRNLMKPKQQAAQASAIGDAR